MAAPKVTNERTLTLKLQIPTGRYLSAAEVKQHNEWCARLAQLALLGVTIDDSRNEPPLEPFAEPPAVKCPNCGNDEIRKFSVVYYQRHYASAWGFNREGEIAVHSDGSEWGEITRKDAEHLAGNWLACHDCDHEQKAPTPIEW